MQAGHQKVIFTHRLYQQSIGSTKNHRLPPLYTDFDKKNRRRFIAGNFTVEISGNKGGETSVCMYDAKLTT